MKTHFSISACLLAAGLILSGCSDQAGQQSTPAAPMLIEPHVSVGKVRAGMTTDQVRAELGEPKLKTSNALEYTQLGFAVMHGPDNVVQVVMCGDVTGLQGPLVNRFTGRTKEGIGLNSTREELIKAYGEPAQAEKFPGGRESLHYDSLGITFSLEGGKVHHMIVRLTPPNQEPKPPESIQVNP
jgi:hypothetical protein